MESHDHEAHARPRPQLDPLERLRGWRVKPESTPIAGVVEGHRDRLAEALRQQGSFEAAWAACAPDVGDASLSVELVRGTIRVRCRSSSARFALDQWLRQGGLGALRAKCQASIRGYRLTAR